MGTWVSAFWLILLGVLATAADLLPLPEGLDPSQSLYEPSMLAPFSSGAHPLGTDTAGLDVLAQVIYSARTTMGVAVGATVLALVVGGAMGLIAGFVRGKTETFIVFLADVLLAFPPLILLMAMVTVLRPTVANLTITLGIIVIPNFVRLSRANTLKLANRDYVRASEVLGAKRQRILLRVLLPGVMPSLVAYGCVLMGVLAVAEGSLSFLGLGIQRPTPTWGNMIAQGQPFLETSPHLVYVPGAALFLTVLAINLVGNHLQRTWGAVE